MGNQQSSKQGTISRPQKLPDRDTALDAVRWSEKDKKFVSHKRLPFTNDTNIDELRIITYNVWFEDIGFEDRAKALMKIFQDANPHIICLQEVTPRFLNILKENPWIKDNYFFTDVTGISVNSYGVLILSQFQLKNTTSYILDSMMDRRALVINLTINGENTTICTVHLESLSPYAPVRAAQLNHIWKILNKSNSKTIFFMGDFNFCPTNNPEEEKNIDTSYKDAWKETHGDEEGPTIGPNYPDPQYKPARFDRLLFKSPTWTANKVELLGRTELSPKIFPSDHLGILGIFNKQIST